MAEAKGPPASVAKKGKILVQPGKPLEFTDVEDTDASDDAAISITATIGRTLAAYMKATRTLLEGKYGSQKELAPPHMREPCNVFVVRCNDGILVRYDKLLQGTPKIRCAEVNESLAELAPPFSEQVIHFPEDPSTYALGSNGPELVFKTSDPTETTHEIGRIRLVIYASITLPDDLNLPPPSARPVRLLAVHNEFNMQMHGVVVPSDAPPKLEGPEVEQFIAHGCFKLPVGWQTIEIYPPLGDEYWKAEHAPTWAELDLLAVIAQKNLTSSTLSSLDSRGASRKLYAALLDELEALLAGPEEPVHQFLKQHPELLCPTSECHWSKLAFGDRVSDFVFREPYNDYLLVELEAPIRELFRKDGQQREELTHAINQISDWIQYIGDNKLKVEEELGLVGISTNPRSLVVIGRSESLSEENRLKLVTLQSLQNKLRILTYDDLIARARANLERLFGPLKIVATNAELYFFKELPAASG